MEGSQRPRFAERSASFIGTFLLAGRLLERAGAFGQVLLIAAVLGSTTRADLYFIASIVPLAIGNVIGEAVSTAVLPRTAREADPFAVEQIFAAGFWLSTVLLLGSTAVYVGIVIAIVPLTSPAATSSLLPWFAFAPVGLFFGLGTFCAAPLLHFERYVWPALRSATATIVALTLTGISVALGGGVVWIGLAVSTGYGTAVLLLAVEIASIGRLRVFALPSRWAIREVAALWRKFAASAASGLIGGQVFVVIERLLTAPLGVGGVASISYARGVAFTPAVLGQAIGAGLYPSLLRAHAAQAGDYVRDRFVAGLRVTLFVTLVAGSFLAFYSVQITDLFFNRGAVTPQSLRDIQHCLAAFSFALLGWMLTIYSSRVFGALNLFVGLAFQEVIALVVYAVAAWPLRQSEGITGVALAFGIGQVTGGLGAVALIAVRLRLRPAFIMTRAVLPAMGRAIPVLAATAAVRISFVHVIHAPSAAVAVAGAFAAAATTVGMLWWSPWPEFQPTRRVVRRLLSRGSSAP